MKIVVDLEEKPFKAKDDLIVYSTEKGKFVVISKCAFLHDTDMKIMDLQKQIDDLHNIINTFKKQVNEKLENHHKVLGILTKQGEE